MDVRCSVPTQSPDAIQDMLTRLSAAMPSANVTVAAGADTSVEVLVCDKEDHQIARTIEDAILQWAELFNADIHWAFFMGNVQFNVRFAVPWNP